MRRGLSETTPVQIGSTYMTAADGGNAAGTSGGRPLNGAWANADARDDTPGTMKMGATGRAKTVFYPPPNAGGLIDIELRFEVADPTAIADALRSEFATGAAIDNVVIPLRDGRTFTGKAKPDRREGKVPIAESTGDHPHFGGQLRELVVLMQSTEGTWS